MIKFSRFIVICLLVFGVSYLSGCSAESVEKQTVTDEVTLSISDTNPYKAEIADRFNASKIPFVRQALADGVITDAELSESRNRYKTCLAEAGLDVEIDATGEQQTISQMEGRQLSSKAIDNAIEDCESSSGINDFLFVYKNTRENPDKKNPVEMMLKCLKKRGVVEKDVTLSAFEPQYDDWDYMDAHREDFDACYADPNFYKG